MTDNKLETERSAEVTTDVVLWSERRRWRKRSSDRKTHGKEFPQEKIFEITESFQSRVIARKLVHELHEDKDTCEGTGGVHRSLRDSFLEL